MLMAALFLIGFLQIVLPKNQTFFERPTTQLPKRSAQNHCTFPISHLPSTLDPRMAPDATSGLILRHLYEGLTRLNADNRADLALAKSYTVSPDRKTYTFKLKTSYWSNGARLVADDFIYAWQTLLDPKFPSPNAYHLFCIQGAKDIKEGKLPIENLKAKAIDDDTLEISLIEPDATFLELLAFDIFYPVYSQRASEFASPQSDRLISNGPFTLVSELGFGKDIILKKNQHFWDKENVKLNRVDFCLIQDSVTALELFRHNQIDWVGNPLLPIPLDLQLKTSESEDLPPIECIKGSFSYWITLNCETAPFISKETRQAIAGALKSIDFSQALGSSRLKADVPLPSFLRNPSAVQKTSSTKDEPDPRELFLKGCIKQKIDHTNLPHITYVYNTSEIHRSVAQLIKEQLEKTLPIHVVLQCMEWQSMQKELQYGSFIMARNGWRAQIPNALNILEIFETEQSSPLSPHMHNFSRWSHSEYDSLLKQIRHEPQGKKRDQLIEQACDILKEELPVVPLFFDPLVYYCSPKLKNVLLTELGRIDFSRAYLEQ